MEKQNKSADKITEKAFSRLMLTSVLGILVCIMCLCSATWAWFSADISSHSNTLSSGNFDLEVSVTENGALVPASDGGAFVYNLQKGNYTVTLKMTNDTTVSNGFCVVSVGVDKYYTASINAEAQQLTFNIEIKEDDGITVTFSPSWGIPSATDLIEVGDTLTLGESSNSQE